MAAYANTFKATTTVTLTAVDTVVYTNSGLKPVLVRYVSEISSHINMAGTASTAEALVPANRVEILNVDPGKSVNAVRGAAETDAPAWITEVTQV